MAGYFSCEKKTWTCLLKTSHYDGQPFTGLASRKNGESVEYAYFSIKAFGRDDQEEVSEKYPTWEDVPERIKEVTLWKKYAKKPDWDYHEEIHPKYGVKVWWSISRSIFGEEDFIPQVDAAVCQCDGNYLFYSITEQEAEQIKASCEDHGINNPFPELDLTLNKIVDCGDEGIFSNSSTFCTFYTKRS